MFSFWSQFRDVGRVRKHKFARVTFLQILLSLVCVTFIVWYRDSIAVTTDVAVAQMSQMLSDRNVRYLVKYSM